MLTIEIKIKTIKWHWLVKKLKIMSELFNNTFDSFFWNGFYLPIFVMVNISMI